VKITPFAGAFGGPIILNHPPGTSGELENVPHNRVHGALGGAGGFMGGFSTAPLDPMFWLHHCNIDRLWEVWVQRQKQLGNLDRNPKVAGTASTGGWLDEPFDFHDSTGAAVRMTSKEVLNTRVPPLSYEYEDISDPFKGAP
jgi:tyrosinase